ncbi:nucleotidyl transferase AbiEii/AbiGii toxin family protein [Kribbella sp. NPDC051770]|uniref:nucleotidyl transferase AbiEii/AbiGii toxin family protein n=1 Tax=Kribbella sp. NPDC051770 TaxID=3155413 RepID=UPI003442D815
MPDYFGDFEIHLTGYSTQADRLQLLAERHGVKFSDIELDRGRHRQQPMLTIPARGTLAEVRAEAERWDERVSRLSLYPVRVKIEAAPWNAGVPVGDADADPALYFEHHVKLLLDELTVAQTIALTELAERHGARLSRNARRHLAEGRHERFVTQRCFGVGRTTAHARLEALVADLRAARHRILETEEEYVVHDSALALDAGWLTTIDQHADSYEDQHRHAPEGSEDYPATYKPLPQAPEYQHRAAFDPSLQHYSNAYRAGRPRFIDPDAQARWRTTRQEVIDHLLGLIATSQWADHLVLRGSVTLRAWFGDEAREPGDLDFVVVPQSISADDPRLLDDVIALVAADPGPGLKADEVARDEIWTYDRVPGRRLVFPYAGDGTIQLDFVFNEELPILPERLPIGSGHLLTATPELSLGWKLLWLTSDLYPQGKDLYDAVLLAERTDISPALIRTLLDGEEFSPLTVLALEVDWRNFADEYPNVEGDAEHWLRRLALALERSYVSGSG